MLKLGVSWVLSRRFFVHLNQSLLQKTKKANRSGPHLADPPISYYLALAGGTIPFIRRYSTI